MISHKNSFSNLPLLSTHSHTCSCVSIWAMLPPPNSNTFYHSFSWQTLAIKASYLGYRPMTNASLQIFLIPTSLHAITTHQHFAGFLQSLSRTCAALSTCMSTTSNPGPEPFLVSWISFLIQVTIHWHKQCSWHNLRQDAGAESNWNYISSSANVHVNTVYPSVIIFSLLLFFITTSYLILPKLSRARILRCLFVQYREQKYLQQ